MHDVARRHPYKRGASFETFKQLQCQFSSHLQRHALTLKPWFDRLPLFESFVNNFHPFFSSFYPSLMYQLSFVTGLVQINLNLNLKLCLSSKRPNKPTDDLLCCFQCLSPTRSLRRLFFFFSNQMC